jgi:hypothetical protein
MGMLYICKYWVVFQDEKKWDECVVFDLPQT